MNLQVYVEIKSKKIMSRVLSERWLSLWPQFLTLYILIQFRESLEITNPMSRILLTWVSVFFHFCPEELKQHVEEMKSQYSRKTTVEIGVTFARRFKRTLKPSRLDIFVIKQINSLHKD